MKNNAHVFFPYAVVATQFFSNDSEEKGTKTLRGKVEVEAVVKGNRVFDLYFTDGSIAYDVPMPAGVMVCAPELN